MSGTPKPVTVPLREFALPAPRLGSIEPRSGFGGAAAEGREIHLRVQRQRSAAAPDYQPEVPVRGSFDRDGYRFLVEGRMDGLFRSAPPRIEEIKTGFSLGELTRALTAAPLEHPYALQLLTYGYLYGRLHGVTPLLSFHLVSTRTGESRDLALAFDRGGYEAWLERRLTELSAEARQAERRAARRRRLAEGFSFPFPQPRPGQVELMAVIGEGMRERRPLLLQAPTGLGKTVGVLYPVLREALSRGERTVYVTPKNSLHTVAEDAVARFQECGAGVRSLTVTARQKICFQDEPLCHPDACACARDYYAKLRAHGLAGLLAGKRKLTAKTFRDLGARYEVCPFELQLEGAAEADLVICDYNYVFAPRSPLGSRWTVALDQNGRPNLVIDEAHNLPGRGMEYYSPQLSAETIAELGAGFSGMPDPWRREAEELCAGCLRVIVSCGERGGPAPQRIPAPLLRFQEQGLLLQAFRGRYLATGDDPGEGDPLLRLAVVWSGFTEALELAADPGRSGFITTFHPSPAGGCVKITCCDAGEFLRECYGEYEQVVGFSATLKPFDYYVQLSGLPPERVRCAEFPSPFPRERRKILIIPQVSTRYAHRERNHARIAEAISRIAALRCGNYCAFFPEF